MFKLKYMFSPLSLYYPPETGLLTIDQQRRYNKSFIQFKLYRQLQKTYSRNEITDEMMDYYTHRLPDEWILTVKKELMTSLHLRVKGVYPEKSFEERDHIVSVWMSV